ncbi:SH3 domain-containing protein [Vreelandella sp. 2A-K22]
MTHPRELIHQWLPSLEEPGSMTSAMTQTKKTVRPLIIATCLHASFAVADYEQGVQEYDQGHFASAIYEWRQSAEKGDPRSQFRLATMYEAGEGVPRDESQAKKWLSLSADLGYLPSQLRLAELHLQGISGSPDPSAAARWYRRAADQGDPDAQFRLGIFYLEGYGVEQDDEQAARWLIAAAQQGITSAQNNLGGLYENGRGVEQDHAKALEWYNLAARSGDAFAQNNLGAMYANGKGVERNHAWATFWFAMALQNGNQAAADNIEASLDNLEAKSVDTARANIRAGNSTDHDIVAKVERGDTLRILGSNEGWSQVYLESEQRLGWIASSLLE